jgi:hypothetical protein
MQRPRVKISWLICIRIHNSTQLSFHFDTTSNSGNSFLFVLTNIALEIPDLVWMIELAKLESILK